ncbi:TetR family transcriptional regulator [Yoonia sp.]|jgi:AcrR family transcriptional regulator|uniref:TetR family transcriptional regulator n=1 Tax=Yoonia sp. TaxID=2212373 RepID=UPI00404823A4
MGRADLKPAIVETAAKCFARNGVDATSIDQIAHEMGASKGKVYHHFSSKGALLLAVRRQSIWSVLHRVKPVAETPAPTPNRFLAMAEAHVMGILADLPYHRVVVENLRAGLVKDLPTHERVMLSEIKELQASYEDLFRDVIASGQKDTSFRQQSVSITVNSVIVLLNAPIFWYQPRPDDSEESHREIATHLARMALGTLT